MDVLRIAEARSLTVEHPESFLLAFNAGLHAAEMDVDSARFLRSLVVEGHASSAAGFLEGLAAARALEGWPLHGTPYWNRLRDGRFGVTVPAGAPSTMPEEGDHV